MKQENAILYFEGPLNFAAVPELKKKADYLLRKKKIQSVDFSRVTELDSAGVALINHLINKSESSIDTLPGKFSETYKIFSDKEKSKVEKPKKESFFVNIIDGLIDSYKQSIDALYLTSEIVYWSFIALFNRRGQRKGSLLQQAFLIGANATGIIVLLSLIIGVILALQSAAQLRQFGAGIFVADLIAISMVREMGPMMTAIIVAGRSGSAIASEVATMVVTEEVDALKMMAISPVRYVIAPKFNAMTICMPLLVTLSIIVGMLGGMLVGFFYLKISPQAYIAESFLILTLKDLFIGLSKSVFFAWVIVIIGSYYGFKVTGGAEGVGKATTAAVVASIFAVIVLDAVFSLIFLI
jgi:phospholipid/cholesterol/gamma-HCH transport system permease protein